MKKAYRFAIIRSAIKSQKGHSKRLPFGSLQGCVETSRSKPHATLYFFILISFTACGIYLVTYFIVSASSIFPWPISPLNVPAFTPVIGHFHPASNPSEQAAQAIIYDSEEEDSEEQTCKLPQLEPFHRSIRQFIKDPSPVNCETSLYSHVFDVSDSVLRQVKAFPANATYQCCFKSFSRSLYSDKEIRYSKKCHKLEPWQPRRVSDEFIHVICVNGSSTSSLFPVKSSSPPAFQDMFALVPLKPLVEARVTTASSRNKKGPSGFSSYFAKLNVVILGLDGQSRMNFLRQMPLTHDFLISNLSSISLEGYTKVSDNTFPNLVPVLTGLSVEELEKVCWPSKDSYFDDCPFIWKDFSAHGYRTSYAEDSVWMGAFNYDKAGFRRPPTDYYLNPFSNYMETELGHEPLGNSKLCYGSRQSFQVLLNYIRDTAVAMNNTRSYFQFVWAASLFHDYLNLPRLGDEMLLQLLTSLHEDNYLNQTLFILMSDHGPRWGDIRNTFQGKLEERMPLVYLTFPRWFQAQHPNLIRNLKINSNRLTTPFDLHLLLKDVLLLSNFNFPGLQEQLPHFSKPQSRQRAFSLLQRVPLSRTCERAGIDPHWCVCDSMLDLSVNSTIVESGSLFILNHLNRLLKRAPAKICAKLRISKIIQAIQLVQFETAINLGKLAPAIKNSNPMARVSRRFHHPLPQLQLSPGLPSPTPWTKKTISNKPYFVSRNSVARGEQVAVHQEASTKRIIQITIQTEPGNAIFEATITGFSMLPSEETPARRQHGSNKFNWQISQSPSRINKYASQSTCLSDYILQKYCFCTNQTGHH